MAKIPVKEIASTIGNVLKDADVQKVILGTYSDGETRSVSDAISGEVLSPKDKEKYAFKKKAKKKKKKAKINL